MADREPWFAARRFHVSVTGDFFLSIADVWPDGDAPDEPTAEDVARRMRDYGNLRHTLREWNLEPDSVDVEGVEVWAANSQERT